MLNPYALLAALLAVIAVAFGSYRYGYNRAEDAIAARVAAAQVAAIESANAATEAATARAVAQAKAEAAARLSAATVRLKGERDAALKARPECQRDADSMGLLLDAIGNANGLAPTSDTMPDSMHPTPSTSQQQ